jgi:hypothetical protein
MNEPLWRKALCWGAVGSFFGLPILVWIVQIAAIQSPWLRLEEHTDEFKYLEGYHAILAALVFGLAGLNSWDKRNGKAKPPAE